MLSDSLKIILLSCVISSLLLYGMAAITAFRILKDQQYGRYYAGLIFAYGIIIPLTLGLVTSAAVAFIYAASNIHMSLYHAFLWGIGHTIVHSMFAYSRILAVL